MKTSRSPSGHGLWLHAPLLLAAGVVPVALVASCAGSQVVEEVCSPPFTDCGGDCVNTATNREHCGACGAPCAEGWTCLSGECSEGDGGGGLGGGGLGGGGLGGGGGSTGCSDGLRDCSGVCVDTQTDSLHCGSCDVACPAGRPCVDSMCQEAACAPGLTWCNGACVDLQGDAQHCGACERACDPGSPCVDGECTCNMASLLLDPTVPQTVTGSTAGGADTHPLSCAPGSAADATYRFTAPTTGTFLFNTFGSGFDTALAVLDPDSCGEVTCNDNLAGAQSQVAVDLGEGQPVLVVVTGARGAQGSFTLNVSQPGAAMCAPLTLGSALPQTVAGTTAGRGDSVTTSCNVDINGDLTYLFTAPADGRYLFDATASAIDAVVEVLDDGTCTGHSLGCSGGSFGSTRVVTDLAAGQAVLVVVEGFDGSLGRVSLTLEAAPPCPLIDLGSTAPQTVTGSTAGLPDVLTPSCALFSRGEVTYSFTAPADDLYVFDTFGSSFNTVLEVLDGSCSGIPLACNDDASGTDSQVKVMLSAGQTVAVVIDSAGGAAGAGDYMLNVAEVSVPPCPMLDLGTTIPQTVTGNNEGYVDVLTSSCGAGPGGEATYSFTAAVDGYYDFDTSGSSLPVVLSLYDGVCAGLEIGCSTVAESPTPRLIEPLVAGQTVIISVDSDGAVGDYVLTVNPFTGEGTCVTPTPLEPIVPQTVTGDTTGFPELVAGSCGGDASPDAAFSFTAPAAATYRFDTFGSPLDTVLHVHDGSCTGAELDCNDDTRDFASQVSVSLDAGQTVVVVVDGYDGAFGPFTLHVD